MTRANRDYPRQADEAYDTPPWVGLVIAAWLKQQAVHTIWEPAPGRGQLGRALVAHGFSVTETRGVNFLQTTQPRPFQAIVTNPPFGKRGELAEAFIRHALDQEAQIVAMLLRVDFDSGKTRRDIFADCPSFFGKIVLLDRIVWFERPGAKPSENHAWFIWDRWGRLDGGEPCILYAGKDPDAPVL